MSGELITNYELRNTGGRGAGGIWNWGWLMGSGLTASGHGEVWLREQREKEEKKELGIGLVVNGKGFEPQRR